MGCKKGDDANGDSLRKVPDVAYRPQSQCPSGCDKNER
jgi:hypothetical protein